MHKNFQYLYINITNIFDSVQKFYMSRSEIHYNIYVGKN